MKKVISALAALFIFTNFFAFAAPYFKGYAGFMGDFTSTKEKRGLNPELYAQGYFAGQLHFSDKLILRSEFYVNTNDILSGDILKSPEGTDSVFKIQELSAVYRINTGSVKHYIGGFYGEYEPIGSDIFLQRQFGIKPITSRLTESYHGVNGASINHMYGGGLSYILQLPQSLAIGAYAYKDWDDFFDERTFNGDIRVGGAFPSLTFDFNAGYSIPTSSSEGTFKEDVLRIRFLTLHSGFNLLVGNPSSTASLFIQGGFSHLGVDPNAKKKDCIRAGVENLYFLVEPRANLGQAKLAFTFFNIPTEQTQKMLYVNEPFGFDVSAETDALHIGNQKLTVGLHGTFTLGDKTSTVKKIYDNRKDFSSLKKNFDVTPYVSAPVLGGKIDASMTIRTTEFFKFKKDWPSSIQVRIGFRSQF